MDEAWVEFDNRGFDLPFLQNRFGYYGHPKTDAVMRTVNEFIYGSGNLDFHVYYGLKKDIQANQSQVFPVLRELFNRYDFDEYYSDQYRHVWYATITNKAGDLLKIRLSKALRWEDDADDFCAGLMIGKEKMFDKMEEECLAQRFESSMDGIYHRREKRKREKKGWWKMETAVEPEE